jgi:hypothetical protein
LRAGTQQLQSAPVDNGPRWGIGAVLRPDPVAAGDLASAFGAALSDGGWQAAGRPPDIWYFNMVYFTGPVRDAADLIDWVAARRRTWVADVLVTDIQITRWRHTSTGMLPVVLASVAPRPHRGPD